MVLFVLYFGVNFLCCLNLLYVFIVLVIGSGNRVAAYWEIAAHSAYDVFFKYKFVFSASVFSWIFF